MNVKTCAKAGVRHGLHGGAYQPARRLAVSVRYLIPCWLLLATTLLLLCLCFVFVLGELGSLVRQRIAAFYYVI